MVVQINPSKVPIWINEKTLQLGVGPNDQRLEDLNNSQERLIQLLFEGVANDQVELVGKSVGLELSESLKLIELLRPSLVLSQKRSGANSTVDSRFAELIRIGFLTEQSPAEVLANRSRHRICIPKLDRTGLTLVRALSEMGFQKFETNDYGSVTHNDHGELGYPKSLAGVSRLSAANALLETGKSQVTILPLTSAKSTQKTISVISASHHFLTHEFENLKTPHVAIEYRLETISVSNVIRRSENPCLGCRYAWLAEDRSGWAEEAIQLAGRRDQLDDGANLLLATAIACRNIAIYTDFNAFGANWNLNLQTRKVSEPEPQFHPACGCQDLGGD
jgi:hypothetical protein